MSVEALARMPLAAVFGLSAGGFLLLYLGLGLASSAAVARLFPALRFGAPISRRALAPGQIASEIRRSLGSIAIFGLYGVLTMAGARAGLWTIGWQTRWALVPIELCALVVWNDVHFYLIHRALHTAYLFRTVHRDHHRAIRPTPFSTYAMHPAEAALLGSVMVLVMPFHTFSLATLVLFPVVSLALNELGHLNHDLAVGRSLWHPLAASRRHEQHHRQVHGNYGFLSPLLDRLFGTELRDDGRK